MIGDIVLSNVLASACLVLAIYFLDVNEKEPPWALIRLYVVSIAVTFLFGRCKGFLFDRYGWQFSPFMNHFVVAGLSEESIKLAVVLVFAWSLKSFNEEVDGLVYFLVAAAGFSVFENVGYSFRFVYLPYLKALETGDFSGYWNSLRAIVLLRIFSGHVLVNGVTGTFLGVAKKQGRPWLLAVGFLVSVVLHGFWNMAALAGYWLPFAFGLLVLDTGLFVFLVRRSDYFRAVRNLDRRIRTDIRIAQNRKISRHTVVLLSGIRRQIRTLRRFSGEELKHRIRSIEALLPGSMDRVALHGKEGLVERLVRVHGVLEESRRKSDFVFWVGLFLGFFLSGFFLILFLTDILTG